MGELKEIQKKINFLREKMHRAIDQKGSLVNPEVVTISQMLDDVLNQYIVVLNSVEILLK